MKLFTKITPTDLEEGRFTKDDGEDVLYYKVQFIDTISKKVGDEYMDFKDVTKVGCSKEIYESLEIGVEVEVEMSVRIKMPRKGAGGFPTLNFKVEAIV